MILVVLVMNLVRV